MQEFILDYETMEETKNGIKGDSLLEAYDDMDSHPIKYIFYEGIYIIVYSYVFSYYIN